MLRWTRKAAAEPWIKRVVASQMPGKQESVHNRVGRIAKRLHSQPEKKKYTEIEREIWLPSTGVKGEGDQELCLVHAKFEVNIV